MKKPKPVGDGWFRSEEATRHGFTVELRRIALRARVRPLPVILLAAIITAGIAFKFMRKPKTYEAYVVLAITEGELSRKNGIPFDELRQYVWSILLPDAKLLALIEERNLFRLRHKLGEQYALEELRSQFEVSIYKNSFVFYDESEYRARKSARIAISVSDGDPDLAYTLARDLASIVINSHEERRRLLTSTLAIEIELARKTLTRKLADLAESMSQKQAELKIANQNGDTPRAAGLGTDIASLIQEQTRAEERLSAIVRSPDTIADQFTAAGLDLRIDLVEEKRPDRNEQSPMVPVMILLVVGSGALLGAAMFLGAFDSRVHDIDDVSRLGLPVLGYVPGFPGDDVGTLRSRSARRGRVPWFLRWRIRR